MGKPAARVGDMHTCPMVTPGMPPVPHVGGPITGPCVPTVLIGGMPAAVMGDMCTCVGPPDTIILGSTGVFIGGKPAARMGDQCAHGGMISVGCPTLLIGEIWSAIDQAMDFIKNSKFGQTEEGKKVIKKLEQLIKDGKIEIKALELTTRGQWNGSTISINDTYKDDANTIANVLVHEGTHALNEDEFPASKTKITIDEEMRTNENQLNLYEEQRESGFRDPELERRRNKKGKGELRDDVQSRYPGIPEHL